MSRKSNRQMAKAMKRSGNGKRTRAGAEFRAAGWLARHPGFLAAPGVVGAGLLELGPVACGSIAGSVLAGGVGWYRAHPTSFRRMVSPRLRSQQHRWSRYLGWRWRNVCGACDLVRPDRSTGVLLYPRVLRVSSPTPSIDRITVRMVMGQSLRTYTDMHEELAAALGADALSITKVKPLVIQLTVVRGNPFTATIPAAPIPDDPDEVDLRAIELGDTEYGEPWTESVIGGNHWLVSGATGSGKGSLIWNPLRQLGPLIRDGLVRVWMVDPKGGMETRTSRELFYAYSDHVEDPEDADDYDPFEDDEDDDTDDDTDADGADEGARYVGTTAIELIKGFTRAMRETQARLAAQGDRAFTVSRETPLNLLIIDELAMLTALSSRSTTNTINKLLAEVMTQGRAPGYGVLAYLQDASKDVVGIRDLFTVRIVLRTTTEAQVDMVLGDGARDRGALADEIPADPGYEGIGYRVDHRTRNPIRVRAGHVTDDEIAELVRTCTPRPDASDGGQVIPIRPAA